MTNKGAFSRHAMYRTHLDDYAETWSEYFRFKRKNGVLEVAMHTDGGEAKWDLELHRAFIPAFADIHHDPDNEVIILTGTGDGFLSTFDEASWDRNGFRDPFEHRHGYDVFYFDQTKEPFSLLNLEIPVIAAINGPLLIHAELALLNDIVIASDRTTIRDTHYTGMGIVPGDGVHTLFRELLGHNRGKYFLLTGETLDAKQSLDLGLVSEVVPHEKLLDRAWEIAETVFMARNRIQRRVTRSLLVQPWRELFTKELTFGQGLESWACHDYWPMAKEADFDIANVKQADA
ncbi:enoyl-CoA hydratase/isomerase family protein [Streptomyces sp. NPDC013178]|uniref:enoyl-CoA hydratase/isomerase family protein n=1 Tax=Streptomyces sp. NPDC013178 TaxID=3155118 RepID=UPI003400D455